MSILFVVASSPQSEILQIITKVLHVYLITPMTLMMQAFSAAPTSMAATRRHRLRPLHFCATTSHNFPAANAVKLFRFLYIGWLTRLRFHAGWPKEKFGPVRLNIKEMMRADDARCRDFGISPMTWPKLPVIYHLRTMPRIRRPRMPPIFFH